MRTTEITRRTTLLSENGGKLDMVRDGEVLVTVSIPPGAHSARPYFDLLPEGAELQIAEGLVAMRPAHKVGIQPYGPGFTDSGANPDFRPTSADRLQRELRLQLNRMKAATDRVERRERALASIERVPRAPQPAEEPRDPTPQPEGEQPEGEATDPTPQPAGER